jgi:hypothetical protein
MRILENARKEVIMQISEFEKAFRASMLGDLSRPALAAPGISGQFDVQLPPEFQAAAKTLASRSPEQPKESSLLRETAAQWW